LRRATCGLVSLPPVAGASPPGTAPGEIQANALTIFVGDSGTFQLALAGGGDEFHDRSACKVTAG
jgi:hypothetical protein